MAPALLLLPPEALKPLAFASVESSIMPISTSGILAAATKNHVFFWACRVLGYASIINNYRIVATAVRGPLALAFTFVGHGNTLILCISGVMIHKQRPWNNGIQLCGSLRNASEQAMAFPLPATIWSLILTSTVPKTMSLCSQHPQCCSYHCHTGVYHCWI